MLRFLKDLVKHKGDDPTKYEPYETEPVGAEQVLEVGSGPYKTRFVVVSDTHEEFEQLTIPDGDVLIHCGDFTNHFSGINAVQQFNQALGRLPHRLKICTAGNHETSLKQMSRDQIRMQLFNAIYLQDTLLDLGCCRVYGCPWIVSRNIFYRANAFALEDEPLQEAFSRIDEKTDILVTHLPPLGVLDVDFDGKYHGSIVLRREVINRVKPLVHCFGHNHDNPGVVRGKTSDDKPLYFVNASQQHPLAVPVVIDLWSEKQFELPKEAL